MQKNLRAIRQEIRRTAPLRLPFNRPHSRVISKSGAGGGNRTRVASLEDWNSAIELRPQRRRIVARATAVSIRVPQVFRICVEPLGRAVGQPQGAGGNFE